MVPRFLRIPAIRAFPRVTAPLLPLAARLGVTSTAPISLAPRRNQRLFHNFPARLTTTNSPPPSPITTGIPPLPPDATLSQKLKHLIKSYGWYALGVYIVLSAVDFGVAFIGVNLIGAEHVAKVANGVKEVVMGVIHSKPPEPGRDEIESTAHAGGAAGGHEGLYAMLIMAYTIHKTLFVPVRVGLTAALTPKLVGWLGRRGWAGGAGAKRAAAEMRERLRSPRGRP